MICVHRRQRHCTVAAYQSGRHGDRAFRIAEEPSAERRPFCFVAFFYRSGLDYFAIFFIVCIEGSGSFER
jgi:hypothetical protein